CIQNANADANDAAPSPQSRLRPTQSPALPRLLAAADTCEGPATAAAFRPHH
uniref:Uncharacterized protein n=1 Tax=Aegilops tauschii subsp. strangulata TaxID=200361 RepID=A0A453QVC1_AEGTS